MWLAVASQQVPEAAQALREHEESGLDQTALEAKRHVVDFDAPEAVCPACGTNFATTSARCPDCGLNFGG